MQINVFHPKSNMVATAMPMIACLLLSLAGCKQDPVKQKNAYLQSGLTYQKQGKFREAVIQYSNALQVDPNFAEAHVLIGQADMVMGDLPAAYRELERAVALNPSNVQARGAYGLAALQLGEPDQRAANQVQAIFALMPNDPEAYNLRARIDLRQGDRDKARQDAGRAVSMAPHRASFHTTLALAELNGANDNTAAGKKEVETALASDPYDVEAHHLLAGLLLKQGNLTGAVKEESAAVHDSPLNLQLRLGLAQMYVLAHDQAGTERVLYKAVEDFHESDRAVSLLQSFYVQSGQANKAVDSFAALSAKFPQSVPLRVQYAGMLMSGNKFDQAQTIVTDLRRTNGSQPRVRVLSALLLLHQGKTGEAIALLQTTANDSPDSVEIRLLLARTAASMGDFALAETQFAEVLRQDRANGVALTGLAEIAMRRKDYVGLARLANSMLAVQPQLLLAHYWRGIAEAGQGRPGEAQADFNQILKVDAGNASALRALGELKLEQSHDTDGVALLEHSLSVDPNSLDTVRALVAHDVSEHQTERAESRVRIFLASHRTDPDAYSLLASLQLSKRDFAGASSSAENAIGLNGQDANALMVYTQVALALKSPAKAIALWTSWQHTHPSDARAMTMLGMLEETNGQTDKAMEFYTKAVAMDANQALAANNLAYLTVQHGGDLQVALSLAQRARKALPASPNTADTLAWVDYALKDYRTARGLLEDACRAEPKTFSPQYHLGLTYLQLHDPAKATLHLRIAQAAAAAGSKEYKDATFALDHLSAPPTSTTL